MALYVKEENCLEMDVGGRASCGFSKRINNWSERGRFLMDELRSLFRRESHWKFDFGAQDELWVCVSAQLLIVCVNPKCAGDDAAAAIQVSVGEPTNVSDVASSAVSAASLPTASSSFRSQSTSFAVLVLCCQFAIVNRHIFHQRWLHSNGGK